MSLSDDSQSISPMLVGSTFSLENFNNINSLTQDERPRNVLDTNEDDDQDEGINDEPELDDDDEILTPTPEKNINNMIPIKTEIISVK